LWQNVPPQLYGLVASFVGMLIGSSLPPFIKHREADPEEIAKRRTVSTGH
jgi:hypothetical protein